MQAQVDLALVEKAFLLEGSWPSPGFANTFARADSTLDIPRKTEVSVVRRCLFLTTSEGLDPEYSDEGDWQTWDIIVTNTGTTTLSQVTVTDSVFSKRDLNCNGDFSSTTNEFLPVSHPNGTSLVCRGSRALMAWEVELGNVGGVANVSDFLQGWVSNPDICAASLETLCIMLIVYFFLTFQTPVVEVRVACSREFSRNMLGPYMHTCIDSDFLFSLSFVVS